MKRETIGIRKPIAIRLNAVYKRERKTFTEDLTYTDVVIYMTGNKYSYDDDGNPYGEGVFYSHDDLMSYIYDLTTLPNNATLDQIKEVLNDTES